MHVKWNYRCPQCSKRHANDWGDRDKTLICPNAKQSFRLPSPEQQHDGFVDSHEWPEEMERAVVLLKGNICTVPGCKKPYETLDHRIPWSNNGHTSVENLFPMCKEHNGAKGDMQYNTGLSVKDHQPRLPVDGGNERIVSEKDPAIQ